MAYIGPTEQAEKRREHATMQAVLDAVAKLRIRARRGDKLTPAQQELLDKHGGVGIGFD